MKYISVLTLFFLFSTVISGAAESASMDRDENIAEVFETNHIRDAVKKIDDYYQAQYHRGTFNGNILIAYKGEKVYQKSFGYAVKSTRERLTDISSFQLASTSKPFTAAAILLLYEQDKLGLDDLVTKYYPDFPYKRVTIRHLLSHRSGIPDYLKLGGYFKQKYISNEDVMSVFARIRPRALNSANAVFKYNNSNYVVLAALVEKISGQSFSDFLEENIFNPLEMENTWVWHPTQNHRKNQTYAYNRAWVLRQPDKFDGATGDKGIHSTAEDLLKWDQSWKNHTLLKKETIEAAYAGQSYSSNNSNYGLGWRIKELDKGKKMIYHNGWWHDYNIVFKRFIDDDLTIIILSNKYNQSVYKTEYAESLFLKDETSEPAFFANYTASKDNTSLKISDFNPFNMMSSGQKDIASGPTYYIVKKGDTLFQISQRFNTTVSKLKQLNKLASGKIFSGQQILIQTITGE